jgi:hypothetical protein
MLHNTDMMLHSSLRMLRTPSAVLHIMATMLRSAVAMLLEIVTFLALTQYNTATMRKTKITTPVNRSERRVLIFTLAKLRFNRLSASDKVGLAAHVIGKMTNNPHFPNPTPSLAALDTAAQGLFQAQAALDGSKIKTVERDTAEAALDKLMSRMQSYVNMVADGDRAIVLSSGMDVRNARTKKQTPEAVEAITLKLGMFEGSMDVKWKGQGRGCVYQIFATKNLHDESSWKFMDSTSKQSITITGLESGELYYFRILCQNSAGKGPYSQPYGKRVY